MVTINRREAATCGLPLSVERNGAADPVLADALRPAPTGARSDNKRFSRQTGPAGPHFPRWSMVAGARNIGAALILGAGLSAAAVSPGSGASLGAQAGRLDPQKAFEISQSAIGRPLGNHELVASSGETFPLGSYRGKPLIVSLVYSSCSSFCPVTTQHLLDAVQQANRVIGGERFAVLTVGFDARNDTPARMALFAANQHVNLPNWRVASASGATIQALLKDLGFSYAEIAGGFDHIAQTTIIGSDGKIVRQVYGENFPVQMLMEPLKDAVYGRAASWSVRGIVDRVKFICTTFDPNEGRYRIDIGSISGVALGALGLILMAVWATREWRRTDRPRDA